MGASEKYFERIEKVTRSISRKVVKEIEGCGEFTLTRPQFAMLDLISKKQGCKITSLAQIFGVKPSAITGMIDRLVASNYVFRHHDEADRRSVLVSITSEGQKVLDALHRKYCEVLKQYYDQLTEEELEFLVNIYEKLDRFDKEGDQQ